jgi:hypothetical protein
LPFGENTRYDLVIDDGARLVRVQCKTGRLRSGAVMFSTASTYGHHRRQSSSRRAYDGEVDYLAVYCASTGGVYLVPIEHVPTRTAATLRINPARNGQRVGVRVAAEYGVAAVRVER